MAAESNELSRQTIYQMVDKSGKPSVAAHTMPLWVDKTQSDVFSLPTSGNKIQPFITGEEYFADLIKACDAAAEEIYIAGWQVSWDALLAENVRLYDLLLRCAKRGIKIYVMPWDDKEPVQTYDDQTKVILESINGTIAGLSSRGHIYVSLCESFASVNKGYFSHHQKQVIVDRKIAYVGGMDLCYGRFDDCKFDLDAGAHERHMLNRYNPGLPALKKKGIDAKKLVDPDLMTGPSDSFGIKFRGKEYIKSAESGELSKLANGGWQVPYGKAGGLDIGANSNKFSNNKAEIAELDAGRQPRMPWQDVHTRIEGPAVSALLKNFILRWNAIQDSKNSKLRAEDTAEKYKKSGNASIQVLRSAPASHCLKEFNGNSRKELKKGQQDIYVAMKNMIAKATRFIYIENQFFVSDFGEIGGPTAALSPACEFIRAGAGGISGTSMGIVRGLAKGEIDELPENTILKSILARFRTVILDDVSKPKFHVYITLPVHPEGPLTDGTIAVQVYYTMQTLVFGSNSLINGLRRLIKARELKDQKDKNYLRVLNAENSEYLSVDRAACNEYVTLMNLRSWKSVEDRDSKKTSIVTEQIYVHSKLMIVDDRFALIGSANINDRSLLGERDSEIAVLVMDDDTTRADINGKGSNQPVRVFAHELRKKIWEKLFGISGKVSPATELASAVLAPGSQASWKDIQRIAQANTEIYEKVFPFIPRNKSFYGDEHASILPTWQNPARPGTAGSLKSPLPSQEEFWKSPFNPSNAKTLGNIKGFITAIPLSWTEGENNRIKYPTPLIVENEVDPEDIDGSKVQYAVIKPVEPESTVEAKT